MNQAAAQKIAETLVAAVFETLETTTGQSFSTEVDGPQEPGDETLSEWLDLCPVVLAAKIDGDLGAVALLLSTADAVRLAAAVSEGDPEQTELSDEHQELLVDIGGAALGAGAAKLADVAGHDPVTMQPAEIADDFADSLRLLQNVLGSDTAGATFQFQGGEGFDSSGIVVWSQDTERMLASDEAESEAANASVLSQDEVGDILSGFDSGDAMGSAEAGRPSHVPENLDMVLDIRLVATARLGKVDIPLREVLHYGPGSIIELDKLVDEPVDLMVNDKLIARGDVVVVDEKFGLRITEIVSQRQRIESLR